MSFRYDIVKIITALSALVAAFAGVIAAYVSAKTKQRLVEAKVVVDATQEKINTLEENTNNKMDRLLTATNAASFKAGQEGGLAPHAPSVTKDLQL